MKFDANPYVWVQETPPYLWGILWLIVIIIGIGLIGFGAVMWYLERRDRKYDEAARRDNEEGPF